MDKLKRLLDNPWLQRCRGYRKLPDEKAPTKESVKGLHTWPANIIVGIGEYLRPEDRAALTLTNRTIYDVLGGPEVLKNLDQDQEYRLLLYLSKDCTYLPLILCQWCRKFHSPRVPQTDEELAPNHVGGVLVRQHPPNHSTTATGTLVKTRKCETSTDGTKPAGTRSVFLPSQIRYNMVEAIMFCHRNNVADNTSWLPEHLVPTKTLYFRSDTGNHQIRHRHEAKISPSGKTLLLKTETLVHLGKRQTSMSILESIAELTQWMSSNPRLHDNVCEHFAWTRCMANKHIFITEGTRAIRPSAYIEQWTSCPNENAKDRKKTGEDEKKARIGPVRICDQCYTDYAYTFLPIPRAGAGTTDEDAEGEGEGVMLLLTTWKDLGTGLSVRDDRWQSHLPRGPVDDTGGYRYVRHYPRQGIFWDSGLIAEEFEGHRPMKRDKCPTWVVEISLRAQALEELL